MRPVILALAAAGAALAACSPKAPEAPSSVAVAEAWCRPTSEGAPTAACYLTLTATADDRLTAVATPLAERGEIHAMDMSGGVMRMRKLEEDLAQLEEEGAKADIKRKVREAAEKEAGLIRTRAQRQLDRIDEVWARF